MPIRRWTGEGDAPKDLIQRSRAPLSADDIADCIAWVVTRPRHVNIDEMVVRPVAQATATQVARGAGL